MAKRNGGIIGPSNVPTGQYGGTAKGVWRLRDAFNYIKAGLWPGSASYSVGNSLRFNSASSDYLSRTPASTTNQKTFTISAWVKLSSLSNVTNGAIFNAYISGTQVTTFFFYYDQLWFYHYDGAFLISVRSTQLFRDTSAWYHVMASVDTTQATSTNRVKLYVNGSQITDLSASTYGSQNQNTFINSTVSHTIGRESPTQSYIGGYVSEFNFIDGQQLTPSSFGVTDSATGIWIPKPYYGTYGTNGFYQKYANSAALGTDSSGNANTFTANNLTSVDQSTDTPTNNYSTVNPLAKNANNVGATPTEGALTITASGVQACGSIGIPITSGTKWYYEFKGVSSIGSTTDLAIGWATDISAGNTGASNWAAAGTLFFMSTNGQIYNAGWGGGGTSWTTGDIIGCAVDLSANSIKWYKNGTLVYTLSSISFVGNFIFPFSQWDNGSSVGSFNFGSPTYAGNNYTDAAGYGNFSYTVPSGHYALNTKNLATYG